MTIPFTLPLITRRQVLCRSAAGFGMVGLAGAMQTAGLLTNSAAAATGTANTSGQPHFAPRAKRVIYLFMNGGPSHVDTFDPKPALKDHEGKLPEGDTMRKKKGGFVPSPFAFAPRGESGVVMSELFPNLARHADDLCVIRSMHTDVPNHEPGLLLMHSGNQQPIRPSLGSWVSYGLGSENANLRHPTLSRDQQRQQLDLLEALNRLQQARRPGEAALETQIQAMETAFQMQTEASEAFDISREPEAIREAYGKTNFGQQCLLARRLCEHGVRFVSVYYLSKDNNQPWDTHSDNDNKHRELCADADRATSALLTDLKSRGLLEDTLVVWGGEFGRTPYAEPQKDGKAGRDHHHTGFSLFLAGGGVQGGLMYGSTDELGMHAVENRVHVHDLHATILHLLGLDHERLTYHYSGRDFRLTDVHGQVVEGILA